MKKQLLLFSCLLLAFLGYGQEKQQTIGFVAGPIGIYYPGEGLDLLYSAGAFYDHQFTRRSGLSIGVGLLYSKYEFKQLYAEECRNCETLIQQGLLPEKVFYRNTYLEVPVNYTFTLNPESATGFKALLYTGVTFNSLVSVKETSVFRDREAIENVPGQNRGVLKNSYLNLGFEMRKNLGERYVLGFGTRLLLSPSSFNYNSENGIVLPMALTLKLGRNL